MTIEKLIEMVRSRIAYLSAQRNAAERIGDVDQVSRLDAELAECEATLEALLSA